jgi:hypothetical protein
LEPTRGDLRIDVLGEQAASTFAVAVEEVTRVRLATSPAQPMAPRYNGLFLRVVMRGN